MATEVSQPSTQKKNANALCEVNNMSTSLNETLCEENDVVTGAGISQMICEDPAVTTDEPSIGISDVGGVGDEEMMGAGAGGSALDGEAYGGGGLGCCGSEEGRDMGLGAVCSPVSEGVAVSIEVLECQRGISTQDAAHDGAEVGLDDQCLMTDDEDDQQMMAMDSASIIPEAAMKCGILPIDSAEEDSLVLMSGESVLQSPSDRSPDQQQQQLCVGCKRPITERYLLKVMDQFWHEDCLKCSCCDCRLGEVGSTLFTKANLLLCRRDYLRLFGATGCCSVCSKMIPAFEMVMKAKGNVYHLECFACQQCNHRFCIGDRYYLYDNKILCEFDYEERIVFARLSHGYNALSNIKRQAHSINSLPPNNCRTSNLNGC